MSDSQRAPGLYRIRLKGRDAWTEAWWKPDWHEGPRWFGKTYTGIPFGDDRIAEIGQQFEIGADVATLKQLTPAEVEARAFFKAHLDQLGPVVQRHVRALLGEGG